MARAKGLLDFSGNFEPSVASSFDARELCDTKANLYNAETWENLTGDSYVYVGMKTVVYADPTVENNGFYWLKALPATEPTNWVQVSGSGESGVSDYVELLNKPQINGVTLVGNLTTAELGIEAIKLEVVDTLPELSVAEKNTIYLVPNATDPATRDEFVAVDDPDSTTDPKELKWEQIGSTAIDLDAYVTKDELVFTETEGTADTVGGLLKGTVITDKNVYEVLDLILFAEKFPTLSNPSVTFTSNSDNLVESNTVKDITFTASFNQGSINPQYTATSDKRAGLPNMYTFTGTELPATLASTELSVEQTISHTFDTLGAISWTAKTSYDAGVQPKSSKGNDFSSPLAAGDTAVSTVTITAVNPVFATTATIGTMTKAPLIAPSSAYIEVDFVAEDDANKQTVQYGREMGAVTKIEQLNTLSGAWDNVDLGTFTISDTSVDINAVSQNYYNVVHNGSKIGGRKMRFHT